MAAKHILVVEDETIVAEDIKNRLEKLGYSVTFVVSSGDEAVEKASESHPDLVLMDIRLEGKMDGIKAARIIHNRFNIPVVYLTAYADDKTLQRAKITEPYGYIIKPYTDRELKSNIEISLYKHKMENKLRNTKDHLKNIINSTSEIVISFDKNFRIVTWNSAAEFVTGYKKREVILKDITKLGLFDNVQEVLDHIKNTSIGKRTEYNETILKGKNDDKRIINFFVNPVINDKEENCGILFVGKDMTNDLESHGKLIRGHGYLISDRDNKSALDLFITLNRSDHQGLFITRAGPEMIQRKKTLLGSHVAILSLRKLSGFENIPDLESLIAKVKDFSKKNANSVILLDGIHYLLTRFSFERFTDALYEIREIVSDAKSILLLRLDPLLLDDRQMAVIENELMTLPSQKIDDIEIGDDLFDILSFIYKQNQNNA